jgi:hypothetical protein
MISFGPCLHARPDRHTSGKQTCLHDLAAGLVLPSDLCPACTTRWMVGLEWVAGQPLEWHARYITQSNPVTH